MAPEPAGVQIEEVTSSSEEVAAAVGRLVGQLSSAAAVPDLALIDELVESSATRLLVARDRDRRIIGMLTLALFSIPTGVRVWIEDVVVERDARGRGIGAALTLEALELARTAGARTVDLTSRPAREDANRMYLRLGFQLRETNVYRCELLPPSP